MSSPPAQPAPLPPPQPLRFGPPARELFGMYQPPAGPGRQTAVLLCRPFGQEAIRSHRAFRVLSERLARLGFAVLRFDAHGTGDAGGDDADASLSGWTADVLTAQAELARLSGRTDAAWIGLRLGATLAALAAGEATAPPRQLVLWEPVTDGPAYLAALATANAHALDRNYGLRHRAVQAHLARLGHTPEQALGFALPAALRRELEALTPARLAAATRAENVLLLDRPGAARQELLGLLQAGSTSPTVLPLDLEEEIDWSTDEAMNSSAIVPARLLQGLTTRLAGLT